MQFDNFSEMTSEQRAFMSGIFYVVAADRSDRETLSVEDWKKAFTAYIGAGDAESSIRETFTNWKQADSEVYGNAEAECGNSDGDRVAVCTERCGSSA